MAKKTKTPPKGKPEKIIHREYKRIPYRMTQAIEAFDKAAQALQDAVTECYAGADITYKCHGQLVKGHFFGLFKLGAHVTFQQLGFDRYVKRPTPLELIVEGDGAPGHSSPAIALENIVATDRNSIFVK